MTESGFGRRSVLAGGLALGLVPSRAWAERFPTAFAPAGTFVGNFGERAGARFRGIRYGRAERFRAPVAVAAPGQIIPAAEFGPIAPQRGSAVQSEDCLFLNVWTPSANPRAGRPVMVYFHGGAYSGGTVTDPHTAWLLMRSLETLHIRMERSQANAVELVRRLRGHAKIEAVLDAGGAESSPQQRAIFSRQCSGPGSTFSLRLKGGEAEAFRMLNALRLFKLAVSLGGTESLVSHPSSTTHSDYTPEAKARCGIGDNLVRLSVGIENVEDLAADLLAALDAV